MRYSILSIWPIWISELEMASKRSVCCSCYHLVFYNAFYSILLLFQIHCILIMNFRINGLKNTKPHETCTLCVETVSTEKINKYTNNKSPAIEQQWQQQQHRQWQFLVFTLMVTSFLRPSNHETSTSNGFYMFRFFRGFKLP